MTHRICHSFPLIMSGVTGRYFHGTLTDLCQSLVVAQRYRVVTLKSSSEVVVGVSLGNFLTLAVVGQSSCLMNAKKELIETTLT